MHPFYGQNSRFFGDTGQQGNDRSWWIGLVSMLMYLAFWGGVFITASRLARKYFLKTEELSGEMDPALSIIRERYAKGEIDTEEFKEKKAKLKKN